MWDSIAIDRTKKELVLLPRLRNRGFTLIELLGTVAILAVILTIAIPATLHFVKQSKEKAALTECAEVVQAANHLLFTEQGADAFHENGRLNETFLELVALQSNTQGDMTLYFSPHDHLISFVKYRAPNGVTALYNIERTPSYYVSTDAIEDYDTLARLTLQEATTSGTISEVAMKQQEDAGILERVIASDTLLRTFVDENGGTQPLVSESSAGAELFAAIASANQTWRTEDGSLDWKQDLRWLPTVNADGTDVILFAGTSKNTLDSSSLFACAAYYQGHWFSHCHWYDDNITPTYVGNYGSRSLLFERLMDAPVGAVLDETPIWYGYWVKIS